MLFNAVPKSRTATSYCTIGEAELIWQTRLFTSVVQSASLEDKKKALMWATRNLDLLKWISVKTDINQSLQHPRLALPNRDGTVRVSDLQCFELYFPNSAYQFVLSSVDGMSYVYPQVSPAILLQNELLFTDWLYTDLDNLGYSTVYLPTADYAVDQFCSVQTTSIQTPDDYVCWDVKIATAEYAILLLTTDLFALPDVAGFSSLSVAGLSIVVDKTDRLKALPDNIYSIVSYLVVGGNAGSFIEIGRG